MTARAKRILIVEDEKPVARVLSLKLSYAGFEVGVAGDGAEALGLLSDQSFDLILLDLVMPRMDGFEFMQEMKSRRKKIPVVVLSNLSQDEDIEKAKVLGVKDFFVKSEEQLSDIVSYVRTMLK